MARTNMYRKLPFQGGEPRLVAEVVNNLVEGKSNNGGTVILNTSGTETTVSNERVGFDSVIVFSPRTLNAAGETDHIYIKTKAKGSFVIGHRNHGHSDVELDYIIVG
jgi:hypothetical protein